MVNDLDALRAEAARALDGDAPAVRSCWSCNAAHEHLRHVDYPIWCFACERYLFRGVDITVYDEEPHDQGGAAIRE